MKNERHGNYLIMGLVCALPLLQWACATGDWDVDDSKPYIMLSQHNVELSAGQTATITARLTDNQGRNHPANWVRAFNSRKIQSVSISPSSGASSVQITITASTDFYPEDTEIEPIFGSSNPDVGILLTASAAPVINANEKIFVTLKMIKASMTSQRVSLDFGQSVARGKCTFNIENDSSADTYKWEVVSINGRVISSEDRRTEFRFAEPPAPPTLVWQHRSAEIVWTQKLGLKEQGGGSLSFIVKVKATNKGGKVLLCDCDAGASTFYGSAVK